MGYGNISEDLETFLNRLKMGARIKNMADNQTSMVQGILQSIVGTVNEEIRKFRLELEGDDKAEVKLTPLKDLQARLHNWINTMDEENGVDVGNEDARQGQDN